VDARWEPAPVPAPALAGELETNVRRLLEYEENELAATAERAGRVPELASALASGIDGAAIQERLSSAAWWSSFRAFGCAVLMGDELKAARAMPAIGFSPAEIARAVHPNGTSATAGAGLVAGPAGTVTAAVAEIAGAPKGRVVLVRLVDRQMVARLAMRANIILMLTDGQRDLGTSLPDGMMPEVQRLIGHESDHVLVDRKLKRLAVAVSWTKGLWLWAVSGWDP